MMMTLDSSPNNHSPGSPPPATSAVAGNSPNSGQRNLSAPVNSIPVTPLESSGGSHDNAGGPVKPAWNKPSNGIVEEAAGPVMGADSWPALSKSTSPLPKSKSSSSDDSSKPISDNSVSVPQGPVILKPEKQANTNASHKFNPNHTQRQRSVKRGGSGNGGGFAQTGFSRPPPPQPLQQPPLPPPFPVFETPYWNLVPRMMNPSVRERPPYEGNNNWDTRPMGGVGSQFRPLNDHHPSQRNSSRRGNFGPRGDGLYHNGHGGRRDQWNTPRGSTSRDMHISQQMMAPPPPPPAIGFMRPPFPGSAPFFTPEHVRPLGNPMGFDMAPPYLYVPTLPPESSLRGTPFLSRAPPPPMPLPAADPSLPTLLVNQINYYFSDANLVKDEFLRSNMDDQGRVPISLIASFPRVQKLTKNIQLILDSVRTSTVVEVLGDKLRRRDGWEKWIPSSSSRFAGSGLQTPAVSTDNLVATSV